MAEPLVIRYGEPDEFLVVGEGGWARVNLPADVDKILYVQLARAVMYDDGPIPISVVGMCLELLNGITGRSLDRLRLGRIERAVNNPAVAAEIDKRIEPRAVSPIWKSSPPLRELAPGGEHSYRRPPASRRVRLKLRIPDGRRRPDSFYAQVAEVYS